MIILSIRPCETSRVLLHAVKSYDMEPSRFTSHPRGRCAADFIALKNQWTWPGFETATFASSGQHTNHATEALGRKEYSSYSFTTSAVDGVSGQRHALAVLYPRERTPCTHCTGGWVGPRAGLNTEDTGKSFSLCRGSNLDRLVV
jgi:hypothetical protein